MKLNINLLLVLVLLLSLTIVSTGIVNAADPEPGGNLVVITESGDDPPHLDHHRAQSRIAQVASDPINVTLVRYNENLELVPYLATDWEAVDDTTFYFEIHENAKFHNGREVTAADVKKSIERIQDKSVGSYLRQDLEIIEEVEVLDDYSFRLNLKKSFAPLLDILTRVAVIPVEEVDSRKEFGSNPIGAGPFKFAKWERDYKITLEKFDDFFIENEPLLDNLTFRFVPEYSSQVSMLLAGQADVHLWIKPVDAQRFKMKEDIELLQRTLQGYYYIGFNTQQAPWDNKRLRKAIALGIDKGEILKTVLDDAGAVTDIPLAETNPFYDSSLEYDRDKEKAKEIISSLNIETDAKIIVPDTPVEGPIGEVLQHQLKELGLDIGLTKLEVPTYIERVFTNKDYGIMVCGNTISGEPDSAVYQFFGTDGSRNYFNYSNSKVDRLIEEGRTTYDTEERKKIYTEVFQQIQEDIPKVYVFMTARTMAYRNSVHDVIYKPNLNYEFRKAWKEK